MKNIGSGVRRKLPAAREAVDQFCGELRIGLLAELPPSERFALELLLREALMNAVVHGARDERSAKIACEVRPVAGGMKIRVADGGGGFDWRACRDGVPTPLGERGHGLPILHRYASQVRFSKNGNQVELTRMFHQGEAS
jgi:anti-sigma regulatory factor (Ser/Thr protein kinase)